MFLDAMNLMRLPLSDFEFYLVYFEPLSFERLSEGILWWFWLFPYWYLVNIPFNFFLCQLLLPLLQLNSLTPFLFHQNLLNQNMISITFLYKLLTSELIHADSDQNLRILFNTLFQKLSLLNFLCNVFGEIRKEFLLVFHLFFYVYADNLVVEEKVYPFEYF